MGRMLRVMLAVVALWGGLAAPAPAQTMVWSALSQTADAYLRDILASRRVSATPQVHLDAADAAERAGNVQGAIEALETALVMGNRSNDAVWRRLAAAWQRRLDTLPATTSAADRQRVVERVLISRWQAARLAGTPEQQAALMDDLATWLQRSANRPDLALDALRTARERDASRPGLAERIRALGQAIPLQVLAATASLGNDTGTICLATSQPLAADPATRWSDFVQLTPPADVAHTLARDGRQLCLSGVAAGQTYRVTARAGLPARDTAPLAAAVTREVRLPDLTPRVSFPGNGWILPQAAADRLPVTTLNVSELGVWIYRVPQQNLPARWDMQAFSPWDYGYEYEEDFEPVVTGRIPPAERWVGSGDGELVWEGTSEVTGERNRAVTTILPIGGAIGTLKPGLYAVVAFPKAEGQTADGSRSATQWLVVTDLAVSTLEGRDGTLVQVRSIASARPVAGVSVTPMARNRETTEALVTDADGLVRLPPGAARGGQRITAVLVRAPNGDTSFMRLNSAALDLSDRGIGGRQNPGPLDAFVYTDRGIYRPGETVNVTALVRDEAVRATPNLPLTLRVRRPTGTVFRELVVADRGLGGHVQAVTLPTNAARGVWRLEALVDRTAAPIGVQTIEVQDFVPEQIAVELSAERSRLGPGETVSVEISARFLYDAPGSGLETRASLILDADPEPFPRWRGWRFGLDGATFASERVELTAEPTNADGRTRVAVSLPRVPDVSQPLRGLVEVDVLDPGGRAVRGRLPLTVTTTPVLIALKPDFTFGSVDANSTAAISLAAVQPDGTPIARTLEVSWFEERIDWLWFNRNTSWRDQLRSVRVAASTVDVSADQPLTLRQPVAWGRYRLEVRDAATGAVSSIRFHAGWRWNLEDAPTPDVVELATDRDGYRAGETATLRVSAPFDGEALVTIATDRVWSTRMVTVQNRSAEVQIPVDAGWGPGAYVTVSLVRPRDLTPGPQPIRAVGVVWVARSAAERTLGVALTLPDRIEPMRRLEVPVTVTGAGSEAYVTLAAVDEGILRLTSFQSPDPLRHYLARRALGVRLRDQYANLITLADGTPGRLRQGGDFGAGLDVVPFKILSLFQGPVRLDPQGRATITLDVPDFVGSMRVMAVAWDEARLGSAAQNVIVRKDVVADLNFPRFLAPGDRADLALNLHNVEGAAGDYRIEIRTDGPATVATPGPALATLARGERRSIPIAVSATGPGIVRFDLMVTGPGGLTITRDWSLQIRSPRAPEHVFTSRVIQPGEQVALDRTLLQRFFPGTGQASISLGANPRIDVAGLQRALEYWAYGCLEQVVARALPMVAAPSVAPADALDQAALSAERLFELQQFDGWFGLWSPLGERQEWLSAMALDFLARAREAGVPINDYGYQALIRAVSTAMLTEVPERAALEPRVAAVAALARAGAVRLPMVRYLADGFGDRIRTQLGQAQLGWALWKLGDTERARRAFERAIAIVTPPQPQNWWWRAIDYGSPVRDLAATIALLGETGLMPERVSELADRLPLAEISARNTSTQEQTWLLLAAHVLRGQPVPSLQIDGAPPPTPLPAALPVPAERLNQGVRVANAGTSRAWVGISTVGVPTASQPAAANGMRVRRFFYTLQGQAANLDTLRQGDRVVMVIEVESAVGTVHDALVVHPLPAGWEIENARLSGDRPEPFAFVGALATPAIQEARDDRYAAAVTVPATGAARLAFVVRVVTPGTFELPGAQVMDQYRPRWFARQTEGRITLRAR